MQHKLNIHTVSHKSSTHTNKKKYNKSNYLFDMQVTEQMLYIYYYYYYCCYFDTIIHLLKSNLHRVGRDSQRARPAKKMHVGSSLCGVVPTMCFLLCCTVLVFLFFGSGLARRLPCPHMRCRAVPKNKS